MLFHHLTETSNDGFEVRLFYRLAVGEDDAAMRQARIESLDDMARQGVGVPGNQRALIRIEDFE